MEYPSQLVAEAVEEIARLPGIGRKTALRLVLHLLKQPLETSENLGKSVIRLREEIKYCKTCHIISDTEECTCQNMHTDTSIICVVEDTPDVIAIRNTGQYQGMFHVLGGRISPIDGIGPEDLHIDSLLQRIKSSDGEISEVILALSATMEGDTTAFYITKQLADTQVKMTTIARGIPVGGELEYTDELTLGRSIQTRTNFNQS
jgi:recombination protein RecR